MTAEIEVSVDPAELARLDRRNKVVALRLSHVPIAEIARLCEISTSTVAKDIRRAMREAIGTSRDDLVAEHRLYLEQIRRGLMGKAIKGDVPAALAVVKTLEREAKMLALDAPDRIEVGIDAEDFAKTAATLMRELSLEPPLEISAGIEDADVVPIVGDTVMDHGDVIDFDEPWV